MADMKEKRADDPSALAIQSGRPLAPLASTRASVDCQVPEEEAFQHGHEFGRYGERSLIVWEIFVVAHATQSLDRSIPCFAEDFAQS
jgi:hypothetical protein